MIWALDVACMEAKGMHIGFWWLNMMGRYSLKVSCIDVRITLKWTLKNEDSTIWTDTFDLGWRCVLGCCELGSKCVGFIKCREFVN